jgi:hypothetical protein
MKPLVYAACALALSGCQTFLPSSRVVRLPNDGGYVVMHQAEGRAAYMMTRDDRTYICSEPAPDVALSKSLKAGLKGPLQTTTVDATGEQTSTALALSGRTENVLLLRDMLYYACLYTANGTFDREDTFDAFQTTAIVIGRMSDAAQSEATKDFVLAAKNANVPPEQISEAVSALTSGQTAVAITNRSRSRHDVQAILCMASEKNNAALGKLLQAATARELGWIATRPTAEVAGHPGFHRSGITLYVDDGDGEQAIAERLKADLEAQGLPVAVLPNVGRSRWMLSASICLT